MTLHYILLSVIQVNITGNMSLWYIFLHSFSSLRLVHMANFGCCVGCIPNLFLIVFLCLEYLSSGENLAGCADNVGLPLGPTFYKEEKKVSK